MPLALQHHAQLYTPKTLKALDAISIHNLDNPNGNDGSKLVGLQINVFKETPNSQPVIMANHRLLCLLDDGRLFARKSVRASEQELDLAGRVLIHAGDDHRLRRFCQDSMTLPYPNPRVWFLNIFAQGAILFCDDELHPSRVKTTLDEHVSRWAGAAIQDAATGHKYVANMKTLETYTRKLLHGAMTNFSTPDSPFDADVNSYLSEEGDFSFTPAKLEL
jgi:hypothetical protein